MGRTQHVLHTATASANNYVNQIAGDVNESNRDLLKCVESDEQGVDRRN